MRFFQTLFAGAALVAAALAVEINDFPSEVQPGRSYIITYTPGDNTPTTFILRKGANENLDTIGTLGETTGGSFTWKVADDLPNASDYALEVQQGGTSNYIGPIALSGSTATPSASASSASASSASSASASSASASGSTTSAPTSLATSASASVSVSHSGNSTMHSATLSSSKTPSATAPTGSSTGSSTQTGGAPENTGAASSLASSPLALIFGAVAAMAYLN